MPHIMQEGVKEECSKPPSLTCQIPLDSASLPEFLDFCELWRTLVDKLSQPRTGGIS